MGILDKIFGLFNPVKELVDDLHTSDEERLEAKEKLLAIQTAVITEALAMEKELAQAQAKIVTAEAKSEHWVTSTWRPITMLTFLVLIVWSQVTGTPIPEQMWTLLQLGLGGYVVGRSAEKTIPQVVQALKRQEEA